MYVVRRGHVSWARNSDQWQRLMTSDSIPIQLFVCFLCLLLAKPSIIRVHPSRTAIAGKSVTLKCQVEGFPKPSITWYKGNEPIALDGVKFVQLLMGSLQIRKLEPTDNGEYTCKAFNRLGTVSRTLPLPVQGEKEYKLQRYIKPSSCRAAGTLSPA